MILFIIFGIVLYLIIGAVVTGFCLKKMGVDATTELEDKDKAFSIGMVVITWPVLVIIMVLTPVFTALLRFLRYFFKIGIKFSK